MPTERNVFRLCSFGLFRVPSVLLLLLSGFLLLQRVRSSPAGTASVMGRLVNIPNEVDMNPFKVVVRQGGGAGVSGAPRKETFVSRDGGFSVSGLGPSSHLLEVLHPSLVFEPVLLEVLPESQGQNGVKAFSFSYEHGQGAQLRLPLTLVPRGKNSFFEAREEFNIMALGKNYMVWIMLATVGLMLILPKMQESLGGWVGLVVAG
uniref:ER membrane protein complex subunit 7 beta-sandwich domain-containing protein n=1 Tax=Chromera velia CCMP2878 TaxID=1169474 RepID=A0A0G4FIN8_9ALVE|eukprot:Cvel_17207.t1-p1 / transcript=Cvel_17207.t1 / gene=Cvel_17207 / organism=Chromera_velia_CCMP2878 / gene_product=hypothetical protein / transcript_product=hypothetical protein / location=Cvel_scaffold1361:1229-5379(-) / protein_length=204 / sequence_SO=supercontig / SO=protein_coding / is_pseudo=false